MEQTLIDLIYRSEPSLKFCEVFDGLSPLWDYSLHKHPYIELIYRKEGLGMTELSDRTQCFRFSDTIVYPVGCSHQDKFPASSEFVACCLWIDAPGLPIDAPMLIQDKEGILGNLFFSIHEEYQKPGASEKLISLMLRILLIRIIQLEKEAPSSTMERILQYINTHLTENLSLDHLASLFFLSRSTLTRQFKKATGKTVVEYVNSLRMEQAKTLLATTEKTVEEIAYDLGCNSPKYFFRLFKTATGMTPYQFKTAARQHL